MRARTVLIGTVVIILLAGIGITILANRFTEVVPPTPVSRACEVRTPAGTVWLDPTQMANAATIAAVGIVRKLPDKAIVIALATAMQESKLENLDGGDRDSVGLFQQRPSQGWGTVEQISNPRYAAGKFYTALVKVRGWQDMRVTEAAQRVQRSAFPEAYEKWASNSTILVEALAGRAGGAVGCTLVGEPTARGPAAAQGLGVGLKDDWGLTTQPTTAVPGVALSAASESAGWQLAHWLVAHAEQRSVARVRYRDLEWTANAREWTKSAGAVSERVVAAGLAGGGRNAG